jgi:hypothetical protein
VFRASYPSRLWSIYSSCRARGRIDRQKPLFQSSKAGLGEYCIGIGEQVGEQIVLDVFARQWLSVVAFDGEGLAALIAGTGVEGTLIGQPRV